MGVKETLKRKLEEAFHYMHITGECESPTFKVSEEERKELHALSKRTLNLAQFRWLLRGYQAPFKTLRGDI